jgi:hypothetical protein
MLTTDKTFEVLSKPFIVMSYPQVGSSSILKIQPVHTERTSGYGIRVGFKSQ